MKEEVVALGAFGLIMVEGCSFTILLIEKYDTITDSKTIIITTYAKFMVFTGVR